MPASIARKDAGDLTKMKTSLTSIAPKPLVAPPQATDFFFPDSQRNRNARSWITFSFLGKFRGITPSSQHFKALSFLFLVAALTVILTGHRHMYRNEDDITSEINKIDDMEERTGRIRYKKEYDRNLLSFVDYSDPKSVSLKENETQQQNKNLVSVDESSHDAAEPRKGTDEEATALNGYKDSWEPLLESDTPVFWHIPKAGGSTFKDIMGACHRFVLASEAGILEGHSNDKVILFLAHFLCITI